MFLYCVCAVIQNKSSIIGARHRFRVIFSLFQSYSFPSDDETMLNTLCASMHNFSINLSICRLMCLIQCNEFRCCCYFLVWNMRIFLLTWISFWKVQFHLQEIFMYLVIECQLHEKPSLVFYEKETVYCRLNPVQVFRPSSCAIRFRKQCCMTRKWSKSPLFFSGGLLVKSPQGLFQPVGRVHAQHHGIPTHLYLAVIRFARCFKLCPDNCFSFIATFSCLTFSSGVRRQKQS